MLTLKSTTAFKKDLQRLARGGRDITALLSPLLYLANNQPPPPEYKDHPLKGDWQGYREFHVTPDWLVIYEIIDPFLVLMRTGSHSDLFKR